MAEYLCKKCQEFSDNKKCVWILRVPIVSVLELCASAVNELEKKDLQEVVTIAGAALLPLTLSLRTREKRGSDVTVPDLTGTMAAPEIANLITFATNPSVLYHLP